MWQDAVKTEVGDETAGEPLRNKRWVRMLESVIAKFGDETAVQLRTQTLLWVLNFFSANGNPEVPPEWLVKLKK